MVINKVLIFTNRSCNRDDYTSLKECQKNDDFGFRQK